MKDLRPPWTRRGFNAAIYGSITQEINYQIAQLRKRGLEPALVRLGAAASAVYAYEQWAPDGRISRAPTHHRGYRCVVPIRYRDPRVSGVVVEGQPKQSPQPQDQTAPEAAHTAPVQPAPRTPGRPAGG